MAEVIIGGETHRVSLSNFIRLEAAWAFIDKVMGGGDPMANIRSILGIVAVGSSPEEAEPGALTPEALAPRIAEFAQKLTPKEIPGLRSFVNPLLVEIGLAAPAGEDEPAEEAATPSTATSAA